MSEEENHIEEIKKETVKSGITIFLTLIISPISIFITIWLTDALSTSDIKVIDSNIVPSYNDVKISSSDLEYLKNDSYSISKIQKFMGFGTSIDIKLAKLKRSSAEKLVKQKDLILADMRTDLKSLKINLTILNSEGFDWKDLQDISDMRFSKKRIRNNLLSTSKPDQYLKREIESTEELIAHQHNRIKDLQELFASLSSFIKDQRVPDNYTISLAIMNPGEVAGAILPSTKIQINGSEYSALLTDDSFLSKFSSDAYFTVGSNSIKVIKLQINTEENPDIPTRNNIHKLEINLTTDEGMIPYEVNLTP